MCLKQENRLIELQFSLIDFNLRVKSIIQDQSEQEDFNFLESLIERFCDGSWDQILQDSKILPYFQLKSWDNQDGFIPSITQHFNYQEPLRESLTRLTIVATLLSIYLQVNFTGPPFPFLPINLFENQYYVTEDQLNLISLDNLSLAGEPAYHLAKSTTFLFLAIQLLDQLRNSSTNLNLLEALPTISWWNLRAQALQRRLLDEPVDFSQELFNEIDHFSQNCLIPFNQSTQASKYDWDRDLLPILSLERGLAQHIIGNDKSANELFKKAILEAKLEYILTGVLGKRTKFQENETSQLVVLAKGRQRNLQTENLTNSQPLSESLPSSQTSSLQPMPITLDLNDDTLLEKTQFTQSAQSSLHLDPYNQPALHPLDQALLLALSLSIKNTSPSHGLTKAQMAPFIERVLENAVNWSVHSMALLSRSRIESHRTRTVERALLQLQALVDQLTKQAENDPVDKSTALERVRWIWALALPSRWELERELAQKLSGLGVIRSALEIFERLEMWEHVVQCHQSLGSKDLAISLVKDLIEAKKVESDLIMSSTRSTTDGKRLARLWCLLGELEANPSHWEKAWQISQHTSSRSMRSLGAHHFSQGNYCKALECFSLALKINPLFNKTWFVYGCAAMQTSDWDEAEVAFRRCVSLDCEDAEAWNNLATVHLKKAIIEELNLASRPEASIVPLLTDDDMNTNTPLTSVDPKECPDSDAQLTDSAQLARPMAAFHALQQAVKLTFDSWKMWSNYMVVAVSVRQYIEATRAIGRVVEIQGEKGLDEAVLKTLVEVSTNPVHNNDIPTQSRLFERVKDVMDRQILVKCPNNTRVWEARSQLSEFENDLKSAIEHRMTAYRVGVSQKADEWMNNAKKWEEAANVIKSTVRAIMRLGTLLSPEDQTTVKWKWQCKSILRSFLNKSKDGFEATNQWNELESFLQTIK